MLGQNLAMLMPEFLREAHKAGQKRYIETGKKTSAVGTRRSSRASPRRSRISARAFFWEFKTNNKHVFIGIARDISARKQAEALLRESEQQFSTLAEVVPQLVWMAEALRFVCVLKCRGQFR